MVLTMLSGCTAAVQTAVGTYNINGVDHQAAFIEGRGTHGATLSTINCYDKDGKLETNNSFGTGGILSSFMQGGLAGAEMGAGIGQGWQRKEQPKWYRTPLEAVLLRVRDRASSPQSVTRSAIRMST